MKFSGNISKLLDKYRIKLIKNYFIEEKQKQKIALKIKNDDYKMEAVKLLKHESYKSHIIGKIKDDNKKMQMLNEITEESRRMGIAISIKDEKLRIEIFKSCKNIENIENIGDFLMSFKVFNRVDNSFGCKELYKIMLERNGEENVFERIKEELDKLEAIKEKNDDEKIEFIKKTDSEYIKSEVAKTLQEDDKKIDIIKQLNYDWSKLNIAEQIQDDDKKIEIINLLSDEYKVSIIRLIQDDNKKIQFANKEDTQERKAFILSEIQDDDKKIEFLDKFEIGVNKFSRNAIISTIKDKTKKLDCISKYYTLDELKSFVSNKPKNIEEENKIKELKRLLLKIDAIGFKSDSKKLEEIKNLDNEHLKMEIVLKIKDNNLKKEAIKYLKFATSKNQVVDSIESPDEKLNCINEFSAEEALNYRNFCEDLDFLKNNIDFFIKKEGFKVDDVKDLIDELYKKNNEIVSTIDFRILKPEYVELFGKDKINLISCYPETQKKILNLPRKQLIILKRCIDEYMEEAKTEEWTTIANNILYNLNYNEYDDLVESIDDLEKINIDVLKNLLQSKNVFNIKNKEE